LRKKAEANSEPDKEPLVSGVEVSTVDGFQGREKEVIIISMVRSNPRGEIGFLSNEKRMNVAVTRAKRLCVLIGDSGTVSRSSKYLKSL
jgi:superfamily I DNA and/or RNA helicase